MLYGHRVSFDCAQHPAHFAAQWSADNMCTLPTSTAP